MPKTRKLSFMALLTAVALGIFMLEAQLPSLVPIPGVKLGLANIITLTAMLILGKKEAGAILTMRVIMGAMFAGPSTLLFSAAGGLLAFITMCILTSLLSEDQLWITSLAAALAHNAGQLIVCVLIVKTPGVLAYGPILAVSGIITGIFNGFAAKYLVKALKKAIK